MKISNKLFLNKFLLIFSVSGLISFTSATAQSKAWIAPAAAQALKNPTPTLTGGNVIYTSYCTPCHGATGKGNGPAASALATKPADHTSTALKNESDGSLYWKISEGRLPMPQYKLAFTPAQRWQLVNYIRSLSVKGAKKS